MSNAARMDPSAVRFVLEGSASHFWFTARRRFLQSRMKRLLGPADVLLDIGCGDGAELDWMGAAVGSSLGVEPDPDLAAAARRNGHTVITALFPTALPVRPSVVTMFDVLEHTPDDRAVLRAVHGALLPGGSLVLTVPAHPRLWSRHDEIHGHFRRYTRAELLGSLAACGFETLRIEWFGAAALAAAWGLRVAGKDQSFMMRAGGGTAAVAASWVYAAERLVRVPFGLSLFAVARRTRRAVLLAGTATSRNAGRVHVR